MDVLFDGKDGVRQMVASQTKVHALQVMGEEIKRACRQNSIRIPGVSFVGQKPDYSSSMADRFYCLSEDLGSMSVLKAYQEATNMATISRVYGTVSGGLTSDLWDRFNAVNNDDFGFFAAIFSPDDGHDLDAMLATEKLIRQANPMFGISFGQDRVDRQISNAKVKSKRDFMKAQMFNTWFEDTR